MITVDSKLFVFRNKGSVITYDFVNHEWSEKTSETENIEFIFCVKFSAKKQQSK